MPWYAKAVAAAVATYAFSPIDLIPDFVPVLGYVDDLVILPLGIAVAIRLIPPEIFRELRERAAREPLSRRTGLLGAAFIVVVWLTCAAGVAAVVFAPVKSVP